MATNTTFQIDISDSESDENVDKNTSIEPLLDEKNNRLTVYPIKYKNIWQMYKKQEACHWVVEEVDLSKDMKDWVTLNEQEQHFIKHILAFFAASDGIVNMNLGERFMKEVQILEAQICYGSQFAMENRHAEAYSLMIETYIKDNLEKDKLFNAIEEIPCIKKKADWALRWIESDAPFAQRLVAFAIVEGVFFSGAFASIFWLSDRNMMPGLCKFNKFISRDEGLHTDFAVLLYSMLNNKLDQDTIHAIMLEAVNIEIEFIVDSLPCKLIGMNSTLMSEYIKFVADRLLVQLNYERLFNVKKNPLDFMEKISMQNKENMFEGRVDEYQSAHIFNQSGGGDWNMDDDF